MKQLLLVIFCLLSFQVQAQNQQEQLQHIRKMYADAKEQIAQNGKNGMAPLDVKVSISDGTQVDEDFFLDDETELTFYFNKYRVNAELDYPDASSCYFVVENWTSHGHLRYREILFDPHEGNLLFCYTRQETDAGFVVETRYYYGADGKLIDQKHKVGGADAEPGAHSWNDGESEKAQAMLYLNAFETLMNTKGTASAQNRGKKPTTPKADRLASIRSIYAQAKQKVADNAKSEVPHDMQIVVRDQSWGPPSITELHFYFEPVAGQAGADGNSCYFISKHFHHNNMGPDHYYEYLLAPQSQDLLFSYTSAKEEGEKFEWRYYYDENGKCIEVKTDADGGDDGAGDKAAVQRYLKLFNMLVNPSD